MMRKLSEPFLALIVSVLILMPTYFLPDTIFQGVLDLTKISIGAYWGYTRKGDEQNNRSDKD